MDADEDVLLTPTEVAAMLRIHPATLRRWRAQGVGPPYIRVGHGFRYRRSTVLAWLKEHPTEP